MYFLLIQKLINGQVGKFMLVFYISEWEYLFYYFILILFIGISIYLYKIREILFSNLSFARKIVIYGGLFIFIISGIGGTLVSFYNIITIKAALKNSSYLIVEGAIEKFKPIRCGSHLEETFSVNGILFSYNGYSNDIFFHEQKCDGGPIKNNGQKVKIYYLNHNHENKIIKMWIKVP